MKKIVVALCILAVFIITALIVLHTNFAKRQIASYLIHHFDQEYGLHADSKSFNYEIKGTVVQAHFTGVRIYGGKQNDRTFFQAKALDVNLPLSSLWRKDFIIYKLVMNAPELNPENLPILKPRTGKSEGTVQIRAIDLAGGALQYQRIPLQDVGLSAEFTNNNFVIHRLDGRIDTVRIHGSGQLINFSNPHFQLNYEANGDLRSIELAIPEAPALKGPFVTEGRVIGKTGSFTAEGKVSGDQISVYGEGPFPARGYYKFDSANTAMPLTYNVSWEKAPVALARKLVPQVPEIASISSGEMRYHGPKNFWQGQANFHLNLGYLKRRGVPLEGQVNGNLVQGTIHLSKSNLITGSASANFNGEISQSAMKLVVDANIKNASSLAFLNPRLRQVPGSYRVHSTVEGPFRNLMMHWNLNGTSPDVQLVSTGSYSTGRKVIQATFSGDANATAIKRFYPQTNLTGQLAFSGNASGNLRNPVLEASIRGTNLNLEGTQIGEAIANLESNGRILNATLELPSSATTAQGSYQFSNHHFELQSSMNHLEIATVRSYLPSAAQDLDGIINANWTASGNALRWKDATVHVDVHDADIRYQNLQAKLVNTKVDLQNRLLLVDANANLQQGTLQTKGSYQIDTHNFQVESNLKDFAVSSVKPLLPLTTQDADGMVTARLNARGNALHWKDAEAHLVVDNANVKYRQYDAVFENTRADLLNRKISLDANVRMPQGNAHAKGIVPLNEADRMDVTINGQTNLSVASMFQTAVEAQGAVTMNVHVGGTFNQPDYSGQVQAQNFFVRSKTQPVALTDATATAQFSGAQVSLQAQGNLNGAPLIANGTIPLIHTPGNLHLTLQNFPLNSISRQTNVQGDVSIQMDAQGTGTNPENWSGKFLLTPNQLMVAGNQIDFPEPLQVQMTSGQMTLNRIHLKSPGVLDTDIQGQVDLHTGSLDASVHGSIEMGLISNFLTDAAAEGKLLADVKVAGQLRNPELTGELQVQNGLFRKFDSPILLEQIQLRAPITKDRIVVEQLTARMGGGTLEGSGEVGLKNWAPQNVNLQVKARSVGMNYPDALRSQLNADLTLTNQAADYLLAGSVQVIRSTYREDIDPRQRLVNSFLSARSGLSSAPTAQGRLKLDITLETLEDLQIKNNLGKVQAAATMQVQGVVEEPRISGRLRVRERSEIYFEGNRFEVQRGNIDFYGQRKINPVFDVELYTIATDRDSNQDYEITIPISGPLSDLDRRDPVSYPPLAPNQVYFLLLTGHADAQISTASSRFFQQQLASYVSGQVFSDLQRKVASSFGLDRVEIQPELVSSETNPGAKLVLGKDFTPALSLIYSVSLTESEDQTWIANYKAPKNLSFRFVDQAQGSYTANVRHLVRFGQGVSTGSLRRPHMVRVREVSSVDINNESILSTQEISKEIGLDPGDAYDFWSVQDKLEKIKQILQDRGVLFSTTEMQEQQSGSNRVRLKIKISGKDRREMVFHGFDVSSSQTDRFTKLWREGFSPEGVTELVRESLLRDLWLQGYHKAEVLRKTTNQNGTIVHNFEIKPGALYDKSGIVFLNAKQYRANELEEDLLKLYGDRSEMMKDAIHNFRLIERKIAALYVKLGYLDASAESGSIQYNGDQAIKEINVHEGKQSRIVDVQVSDGEGFPPDLFNQLILKRGSLYDPAMLTEDEVRIGDFYERLGYIKAQVEGRVQKSKDGLLLTYDLKKGGVATIEDVEIRGAQYTKENLIQKRIQMKEGDILNQDKLASAQKNLTDLRIFHQVTVHPERTTVPDHYRVIVDVIERRHYEATYGFRYDTETSVGAEFQLTDLNLFGTGQTVSLYTRAHRENQFYQLTYHSPTLAGLRWATLLSISYENGNLLLLENNERFDGSRALLTLQKQYTLSHNFQFLPGYQFEYLDVRPLEEITGVEPVHGLKISRLIGNLFSDTRDDPFNTHRGSFFSTDVQYSSGFLGSDVSYIKSFNQYSRFRQFPKFVWAQSYRVGLATDLPGRIVTERFFAGGSYSIRGLKKDQAGPKLSDGTPVGGEALFVLNQEIRFPIWKWFGGAVFYDAGNVYAGVGDFNPLDLRHSVGFGLRLNSPFGIARLDYGINLNPEDGEQRGVLHFALGQAF